jgi:hypothetical protein
MEANNWNVQTVKEVAGKVGRDHTTLLGDGARTWGEVNEALWRRKSLWELFWNLFTGAFVSSNIERSPVEGVFQEHLIVPHDGQNPDSLTTWVIHNFIPFYSALRSKFIIPLRSYLLSAAWFISNKATTNKQ